LSIVAIASPSRALVLAEQWLTRQRQLGDEESIAMALHRLGVTLIDNGGYERSFTVLDECAARFRALGDVPTWGGLAQTLMYRSIASRFLGDYRQALADLDEGDRMSRAWQSSPVWLGAAINYHRGLVLLEMGDLAAATTALKASLQEFRERGAALYHVPLLLASLSEAAQAGGQSLKAARLAGAAAAHAGRASNQDACLLHPCERALAAARARLGDPALAAAWAEGQAMGWDQAIDCALAV
jgi:tetratricopeptide (TPR) repeat protein